MTAREADRDHSATGYVFAIVADRLRCDEALRDVVALGLDADDVHTIVGAEGAATLKRAHDPIEAAEGRGFWTRVAHRLAGTRVSKSDADLYRAAADDGACVIAFPLDGSLALDRVTRLLETHAARLVRFHGRNGETRTLLAAADEDEDAPAAADEAAQA